MAKTPRFVSGRNSIYNIGYHLIWCPKYRKRILLGSFRDIVEQSLLDKSKDLNIRIENLEIMPDHVHLFVKCTPNHRISDIVRQLKGYSSYQVRSHYPKYRSKYKSFWSPSYYCESVGHISESTVKRYIDNQTLLSDSSRH